MWKGNDMTDIQTCLIFFILIGAIFSLRSGMIKSFKIGYYEEKLKQDGADISHVKNITLWKILKL